MVTHKVADKVELEGSDRLIVEVDGLEIAIFSIENEYHAVANVCLHEGGPLCEGELTSKLEVGKDGSKIELKREGEIIMCPWHGWKFDVRTGENIDHSAYRVRTFDIHENSGELFIEI